MKRSYTFHTAAFIPLVIASASLFSGCGGGGGSGTASSTLPQTSALSISPGSITLISGETKTFLASGGTSPYTFSSVNNGTFSSQYAVSLLNPPSTDTVTLSDSVGAQVTAQVSIRKFATKDSLATGTAARGVAVDSSGNIFSVGESGDSWIVRKSQDSGTTWQTVDTFQVNASYGSRARSIAVDSNSNLYVAGYGVRNANNDASWIVRKSTDGGTSWATVDTVSADGGETSLQAWSIAIDGSDNIYVSGTSGAAENWIVRTSSNAGSSWAVSDWFSSSGSGTIPYSIAFDGSLNVYVAGQLGRDWIVKKRTVGSGTWSTVDTYQYAPTYANRVSVAKVAVANGGTIYVVGTGRDANAKFHWLIRKSTDAGATWSMVDDPMDYFTASTNSSDVGGAVVSSDGRLFMAGNTNSGWVIRTPDFAVDMIWNSGMSAGATALALGSSDRLISVGFNSASGGGLLTRILPP